MLEAVPHASLLPIAQPAPARHAAAAAHLLGQHLPRDARLQNEEDAGQGSTVGQARSAALRFRRLRRQQRLYHRPERIREKGSAYATQNA